MKEIENTRNQIQPADVQEFDERIKPIQDEVLAGVSSFREVQQMYTRQKQDKEPKRMPFAKNRHTGNDGIMCTYNITVSGQVSVDTLDCPSVNIFINTR